MNTECGRNQKKRNEVKLYLARVDPLARKEKAFKLRRPDRFVPTLESVIRRWQEEQAVDEAA